MTLMAADKHYRAPCFRRFPLRERDARFIIEGGGASFRPVALRGAVVGGASANGACSRSAIISCRNLIIRFRCVFGVALHLSEPARLCAILNFSPVIDVA